MRKGRHADLKGEDGPRALLTEEQVLEIRAEYVSVKTQIERMAKKYGVADGTIRSILYNHSWKHL